MCQLAQCLYVISFKPQTCEVSVFNLYFTNEKLSLKDSNDLSKVIQLGSMMAQSQVSLTLDPEVLMRMLLHNSSTEMHSFFLNFIYLFIYGCVGSSSPREGSLQLRQVGATLHRGARASHYRGLSCCGAQAPDVQAQQLWLTGLVAPRHVGSSQTRARTRVPCIGRQILNHCATREAPRCILVMHWDSNRQHVLHCLV